MAEGGGTGRRGRLPSAARVKDEIAKMMHGSGDVSPNECDQESLDLMEGIAREYIVETTRKALSRAGPRGLRVEDLLLAVRRDRKKFRRGKELLRKNEEIKQSRKGMSANAMVAKLGGGASAGGGAGAGVLSSSSVPASALLAASPVVATSAPKKRGRKRKNPVPEEAPDD